MGCLQSKEPRDEPEAPPSAKKSPIHATPEKPAAVLEESKKKTDNGDALARLRYPGHIGAGAEPPLAAVGFGVAPVAAPATRGAAKPGAAPAKRAAKASKPAPIAKPAGAAAAPAKKRWGDSDDDDETKSPAKAKAAPGSPSRGQTRKGPTDDELTAACRTIKDAHPDYGVKRVYKGLVAAHPEWKVNERKVQKLMRANGMLVARQ